MIVVNQGLKFKPMLSRARKSLPEKSAWQKAMANAVTAPEILFEKLHIDLSRRENKDLLAQAKKAAALFKLRVPESFIDRMEKNNPNDPLLLQALPLHSEFLKVSGFNKDPLQESQFNPAPGILHKYYGRLLITLTGICGINCRYCFRREFPYQENNPGKKGWQKILAYLSENPEITEIILSGGDPLIAPDHLLKSFSEKLRAIPHIKTLRIHTRMPIVLPERITSELVEWLKELPLKKVIVLHTNHPNEINQQIILNLNQLTRAGVTLLNQSVLLKNINDHPETLIKLSRKLFEAGVLPYYLHLLDKVQGSAHFEVSENTAKYIHKILQETLPGYLVPKLAKEMPGEKHKTLIF